MKARFLIPLALFGVLAGFLAVGLTRDPHEIPSPLVSKAAPQFYAEVSAANAGGTLAGKPMQLIEKALKADPQNGTALWLSGMADLEAKNYAKALRTWQKLAALLPPGSDDARVLQAAIDDLRAKSALPPKRQ